MPDGTAKKRRYTFNYGRLKIFAIVIVLIYTLAALAGQQETLTKQIQRQEELTKNQAELEQRIEYYANELDYIGTDEYVEQEARTRFGWLLPGEIKYVEGTSTALPDSPGSSADAASPSASPTPERAGGAEASPSAAPSASSAAQSSSSAASTASLPAETTAVPTTESGQTLSPEMAHASAQQQSRG